MAIITSPNWMVESYARLCIAHRDGDASIVLRLFAPDAVIIMPGVGVLRGTEAIRACIQDWYASTKERNVHIAVSMVDDRGDIVIDAAQYKIREHLHNNDCRMIIGDHLVVWQRTGEQFQIVYDAAVDQKIELQ